MPINGRENEAVTLDSTPSKNKGVGHRPSVVAFERNGDYSDASNKEDVRRPAKMDPNHSSQNIVVNIENFRFLFVPFLERKHIRTSKHIYFSVIETSFYPLF